MPFLGTIVNFFAVLVFGSLGCLVKKSIPERIEKAVMSAVAVCVIYIGVSGMLETAPDSGVGLLGDGLVKVLVMIVSMVLGTLLGELVDIDRLLSRLGERLEKRFAGEGSESGRFAKGFVSCSLLFCVGAMSVNGAMSDAMGNPDTLIAKSVLDAISCFVMASSFGVGCVFSAITLLVYQGAISVLGLLLGAVLPVQIISYMSVTGSLIILLIGTNMIGCTKVKTANMIPAIFMPIAIAPLVMLIP